MGWGGYRFLKQIWQPWSCVRGRSCVVGHAWSCAVVRGRAWSVVRGRSCVVVRGRSCVVVRGRAWSCVVVRGRAWSCVVVRGRACAVVGGRARSCAVVRGRAWSCRSARFAASTAVARTNERTTYNNPLNPPGVGWVKFFYPIKVRVSMGTCVPNLGPIRWPVRKCCLSNLLVDERLK